MYEDILTLAFPNKQDGYTCKRLLGWPQPHQIILKTNGVYVFEWLASQLPPKDHLAVIRTHMPSVATQRLLRENGYVCLAQL